MKRIFFLISFLLGLFFVSGGSINAQSCFTGASWVGPAGNPPTSNRVKPLYSTCSLTQVIADGGDPFLVQFGENDASVYPNNSTGFNIRVQDTINNAEIQLQYAANAGDHWSIYNNQSDDSFRIWGGSNDRLTILQNGNVGIGTGATSPDELLDVSSNVIFGGSNGALRVAGGANGLYLEGYNGARNASVSKMYLAGYQGSDVAMTLDLPNARVGIGTTAPTEKLEINGNIKITDGSEATGNVLMSDASGVGTWTPINSVPGQNTYWKLNGSLLYASTTSWDVGIGTATPSAKLDVEDSVTGSTYVAEFRNTFSSTNSVTRTAYVEGAQAIMTGGSATSYGLFAQGGNAQNDPATSHALYSRAGTPSSGGVALAGTFADPIGPRVLLLREDTTTVAGDWLGQINFDSTDDAISTVDAPVVLRGYASETQGSSNKGGYFTILTKPAGTNHDASAVERLRVADDGNVGIGSTNPTNNLHITTDPSGKLGTNSAGISFQSSVASSGGDIGLRFIHQNGVTLSYMAQTDASPYNFIFKNNQEGVFEAASNGGVLISIDDDNDNTDKYLSVQKDDATELFRIQENGNVGIGTTAPENVLHIRTTGAGNDAIMRLDASFGDADPGIIFDTTATNWIMGVDDTDSDKFKIGTSSTLGAYDIVSIDPSSGNVGIGTSTPSYKLEVVGDIRTTGTVYGSSDKRLKKNIQPVKSVLTGLQELQPVYFEWKSRNSGINIGLIAQDVEEIFPELVATDRYGYKSIAYDQVSILLLAGVQEQQVKIESLEQRIEKLEEALNQLTNE